ncbi:MAG: alanine racemase [bacterium]
MPSFARELVWVEIDLSSIRYNTSQIKKLVFPSKVMAVVKADGYGHGAVRSAQATLEGGADMFGVASIDEGVKLREAGIKAKILILGPTQPNQIEEIFSYNLIPTIFTPEMVKKISALDFECRCHIKIDTGMWRIGVPYQEADSFISEVMEVKNIKRLFDASKESLMLNLGMPTRGAVEEYVYLKLVDQ